MIFIKEFHTHMHNDITQYMYMCVCVFEMRCSNFESPYAIVNSNGLCAVVAAIVSFLFICAFSDGCCIASGAYSIRYSILNAIRHLRPLLCALDLTCFRFLSHLKSNLNWPWVFFDQFLFALRIIFCSATVCSEKFIQYMPFDHKAVWCAWAWRVESISISRNWCSIWMLYSGYVVQSYHDKAVAMRTLSDRSLLLLLCCFRTSDRLFIYISFIISFNFIIQIVIATDAITFNETKFSWPLSFMHHFTPVLLFFVFLKFECEFFSSCFFFLARSAYSDMKFGEKILQNQRHLRFNLEIGFILIRMCPRIEMELSENPNCPIEKSR